MEAISSGVVGDGGGGWVMQVNSDWSSDYFESYQIEKRIMVGDRNGFFFLSQNAPNYCIFYDLFFESRRPLSIKHVRGGF